jgi:type IV pilus assembly protein PilY1
VGGSGISNAKGAFQPTNQLVDFYVETLANSSAVDADPSVNDGRYYARFRINFEDVEQGADHDMDAIVLYEIAATADGKLRVTLKPEYQAGGIKHSMGYVVSGTNKDGVYLVVQDETGNIQYHLNVPPGLNSGDCDVATPPTACGRLPAIGESSERYFEPGSSTARLLRDPLWFAAKWGGFVDSNGNSRPDLPVEWDKDGDGVPDTYFLVQNPLKLRESLKRSFDTIVERSASGGNITSNGQELRSESHVFVTQFNSKSWDGEVLAFPVTSSGVSSTEDWKASDHVPAHAARKIYTRNGTSGIPFKWTSLSAAQKFALVSEDVLEYLRGDQSKETTNGGVFRPRNKLLGDFVHSSPYYVRDTETLFVGGNDGMLHAFDAKTGGELFSYIPTLVFDKLANLADPSYTHTYYVDGDMAITARSQAAGKNLLVASTGRGSRGIFSLDVTDPTAFDGANVKWEYNGASDDDFGYVLGRPQIATVNGGTRAVVVGNGHASPNGNAVLYIFNLETGALITKIDTKAGGSNGLSTPTLFDSNGDDEIDTVYAGDLKGNVWRFDLSHNNASQWKPYYGSSATPKPFFTAVDSDGNPQPINAQITVALNSVKADLNYGKRFLFFGTGSFVYSTDPEDKQVQSWYGLIDEDTALTGRGQLKERTIGSKGTVAGKEVRVFSEAVDDDMVGKKGWYIDLKDPNPRGERMVTRSLLVDLLSPALIASSIIPNPDPCEADGSGYVNAVNPFNGARLDFPPFDLDNDNKFDGNDGLGGQDVSSFDPGVGMPGEPVLVGDRLVTGGSAGTTTDVKVNLGEKKYGRISWREIVLDR